MDFTTTVTDHMFASFAGGNNKKKDGNIQIRSTNANYCKFGLSRDECDVFENFPCLIYQRF